MPYYYHMQQESIPISYDTFICKNDCYLSSNPISAMQINHAIFPYFLAVYIDNQGKPYHQSTNFLHQYLFFSILNMFPMLHLPQYYYNNYHRTNYYLDYQNIIHNLLI